MSERVEVEPAAAEAVFGDRIDVARRFTESLVREGETRGLIGPLEVPRIWTRHILNSALPAPLFRGRVVDVGSGAGLPGLVLAITRPDVEWTLVEPMERRVDWLNEQAEALALDNVRVVRARAEEVEEKLTFDSATARAVSALKKLIPLTAPLVRDGGELLFLKGAGVNAEIEAARAQIRSFAVSDVRVELCGADLGIEPARVFRATVRGD